MTMNVLVAGSTGKTGSQLVAEIKEMGQLPVALVRESSDTSVLPDGVATRIADLTDLNDDVCADADVVVFAAGSGGSTGAEMTDKVDRGRKAVDRHRRQIRRSTICHAQLCRGRQPEP